MAFSKLTEQYQKIANVARELEKEGLLIMSVSIDETDAAIFLKQTTQLRKLFGTDVAVVGGSGGTRSRVKQMKFHGVTVRWLAPIESFPINNTVH